jgi:hypothetical protein
MNMALIGELVKLRYKLLWAKMRSRNGRIALFLTGYLILIGAVTLLATGGMGAAMLMVRSGRAEELTRNVLSAIFLEAVLASSILGFGMNAVFNDVELRRYPLTPAERRAARQLTGLADPFWLLFLALDLGLAVGLYAMGAGSLGVGLTVVLLLFLCNYLSARVVALTLDRMMQYRAGSAILLAIVLALSLMPSMFATGMSAEQQAVWMRVLSYTPPFGAAAAMLHEGAGMSGAAVILAWIAGSLVLLARLESLAPVRTVAASPVKAEYDTPYDRVASWFGEDSVLVGHWLRFYLRNNRTRAMSVLALPLMAFLAWKNGQQFGPNGFYITAMGAFPAATFLGVARITVNQFGYAGGGFRRYFLFPTEPGAALRAGSRASMLIGGASIPVLLAAWIVLAPKPLNPLMVIALACSSVAGLHLFHTAALWVTLFNPRKGNYNSSLGNDLSLWGNILVIGGVLVALVGPMLMKKFWPTPVQPENWWMSLVPLALGVGLYRVSLRRAAAMLGPRREKLLAVVEGRD